MSLTFQLARGGLALALFGALAVTAWLAPPTGGATRVILFSESATVTVCPLPPPALRLAMAPADLPSLRLSPDSCRA